MQKFLTVKAVVDAVNDIFGSGRLGGESVLVLLDGILLSRGKSRDVVNVSDRLVWSVGYDLSSGGGVHARHTEVGTDVGVVHINHGSTAEVGDVLVIDNGVGSGRDDGGTNGGGGAEEGTTVALRVEGSLGRGLRVRGERGGGAAGEK